MNVYVSSVRIGIADILTSCSRCNDAIPIDSLVAVTLSRNVLCWECATIELREITKKKDR